MTFTGRVQKGVVVLDNGAELEEGTPVRVQTLPQPARRRAARPKRASVAKGLLALAGKAKGLPADAARNADHYLYGRPRKP